MSSELGAVIWAVIAILLIVAVSRATAKRRRFGAVGPAAAGSVYDWLNQDKRKAIEIIVEQRAEARDPEDKDGNLPDLDDPTRSRRRTR